MSKAILAVDDSLSIRQMISLTLKSAGYKVTEAIDGNDALLKAKAAQFDLVLTDINMQGLDGFGLTTQLRALPAYKSTPVLILTTEASDSMKQTAREAGATGYMLKPFDPRKLLDIVGKVLG